MEHGVVVELRSNTAPEPEQAGPAARPGGAPKPVRQPGRFYCPELDGLRFFAFLAVYVDHTFLFGTQGHHHHMSDTLAGALGTLGVAGAFGVDLFFALSAYLITELLLRERAARGSLDVRAFYVRRILRIWPLYFLFLGFSYALAWVVPGEEMDWRHLLGFALFSGNWVYMAKPIATVAAPLWSVSVEEQFYILWPLAVRKGSVKRIAGIAAGLLAVGMALRFVLAARGADGLWMSKHSLLRADGIAAGVLLAVALRGRMPRIPEVLRIGMLLGGVATLLFVARDFHLLGGPPSSLLVTFGWSIVAAACTAILLSALGSTGPLGAALSSRPLVYLGRISYGLYVFHQVGLLVAGRLFPGFGASARDWAGHFAVGLVVTLVLAAASYRWIEQPFLRLKQRRFTVVRSRPDAEPA